MDLRCPLIASCVLFHVAASESSALSDDLVPLRMVGPARAPDATPPTRPTALESLQVIAGLPSIGDGLMIFGDTDRDGQGEVFISMLPTGAQVFEYAVYGQYIPMYTVSGAYPFALGDLDEDGKYDLLGEKGYTLRVLEAADGISPPSILVWESPPLSNTIGYPTIADTDGDGRQEIISSINFGNSRIIIYECTGDNLYEQRYLSDLQPQEIGPKLVGDLDRDGRRDIAMCGGSGYVWILEGVADDTWVTAFWDSTGLWNAYAVTGGMDTDGDGRRELFVSGDDVYLNKRHTFIYQPDGRGSYERIATLTVDSGATGEFNALAQLEPGGVVRFVWYQLEPSPSRLQFYVSRSLGSWVLESELPDPTDKRGPIHVQDLNRNGRDEIYWVSCCPRYPTWVLERPTVATDRIEEGSEHAFVPLSIAPNPCTTSAAIRLDPRLAARARAWSAYDASGKAGLRRGYSCPTDPAVGGPLSPARDLLPESRGCRGPDAHGRSGDHRAVMPDRGFGRPRAGARGILEPRAALRRIPIGRGRALLIASSSPARARTK